MLAARAAATDPDRPLAGLHVEDAPEPEPPAGWEVVEVRAAALNHHDLWTLRGVGVRPEHLPVVLGTDAAGVAADGREVIVHAVLSDPADGGGDETLSADLHMLSERGIDGTLAERVAVPSRNLLDKPSSLSFAEAACLPTAYLTAYRMLFSRGGLRPGGRVLVQGAGGGVGTAAVTLARAAGAVVYATSRTEEKRDRAAALGAVTVEPGGRLPERVDLVVETVGRATWEHSLRALRPGGTIAVSGATSGDPPAGLARLFWRGLTVVGTTMGSRVELEALCRLVESAGLSPVIDSTWPLDGAADALARLEGGEAFGKVVVTST